MTTPTPEEMARMRHEMTNGLLAMNESLAPVFDTADGMRAELEKRGWSPTAAEQVALVWLMSAMKTAMGGVQR